MRKTHTRIAAGIMAIFTAVLAGFALRPTGTPTAALASRNPAVEVRTVVIRRTIHVIHHAGGSRRGPALHPPKGSGPVPAGGHGRYVASAHTGASGARRSSSGSVASSSGYPASSAPAATTRSSGSHAVPAPAGSSSGGSSRPVGPSQPVATRTSGAHSGSSGSSGSSHPVTTRSSGGSAGGEKEHGDGGGD